MHTCAMDPIDLITRLENLLRTGTVADVQAKPPRVRVRSGGLLTGWLAWFHARAGDTRDWDPPTPGEQCLILSPSGETTAGLVLLGLNADDKPPPSADTGEWVRVFPDGARLAYHHGRGELSVTGIQTATIQAAVRCVIRCPETETSGNLTVGGNLLVKGATTSEGLLSYQAGLAGTGGGGAGTAISGTLTHSGGQLSSNGVVLDSHTHPDAHGGNTGASQ
ncbi:phage baseplate assembly protein V [Chromobacterium haemolyticum]|nr:phage baseplate assembly protein V [Chromobacterium haemolyticum]